MPLSKATSTFIDTASSLSSYYHISKGYKWKVNKAFALTHPNFRLLLDGHIPVIRVKNFLNHQQCDKLVDTANSIGFDYYDGVFPPIGKIGITQYEYSNKDKTEYFQKAAKYNKLTQNIWRASGINPIQKVISACNNFAKHTVIPAHEPQYGDYFVGLYRVFDPKSEAFLHFDYAPYDAADWVIGKKVKIQVSWNIYVKVPEQGGECIVLNKNWQPKVYEGKLMPGYSGSYGFDESLAQGVERHVIKPEVGDLYFFVSRNFHMVKPSSSTRISISSFLGLYDKQKLLIWN
jgi:hypothetical protein